jgi:hypothetical protein
MRSRAVELDLDAALSAEAATLGANATRDTKATLGAKPSRRSGAARR